MNRQRTQKGIHPYFHAKFGSGPTMGPQKRYTSTYLYTSTPYLVMVGPKKKGIPLCSRAILIYRYYIRHVPSSSRKDVAPQSRLGNKSLKFQVVCPQNGTALLKRLLSHFFNDCTAVRVPLFDLFFRAFCPPQWDCSSKGLKSYNKYGGP